MVFGYRPRRGAAHSMCYLTKASTCKPVVLWRLVHRMAHGGNEFQYPTLLDNALAAGLKQLSELASLHNQPVVKGIEIVRK